MTILNVTDGTTTVDLVGGGAVLMAYVPRVPDTVNDPDGTVQEPATVLFTSRATARAAERDLNRLFQQARDYRLFRVGVPVYVQFRPDGDATTYRSELFAPAAIDLVGKVDHTEGALDLEWVNNMLALQLYWSRRYYWESTTEEELSLTNGNGSGTGGRAVRNHNDGGVGHDNLVYVATDVKGDLLTPIRLDMKNTYNDSDRVGDITVGHNYRARTLASMNVVVEGEATTAGGTNIANAGASNGLYRQITAPSTETLVAEFDLTGTQLGYLAGNNYRIQARMMGGSATCYMQARVRLAGLSTLYSDESWRRVESGLVTISDGIPLPPAGVQAGSLANVSLALYARGATSGNILLDFVQLTPTDSFAQYRQTGYGLPYNATLTDDGILDVVYSNFGAGNITNYVRYGQPVMLMPGADNHLYFLWGSWTGDADIERTMTVRAWYRRRRVSLASES